MWTAKDGDGILDGRGLVGDGIGGIDSFGQGHFSMGRTWDFSATRLVNLKHM